MNYLVSFKIYVKTLKKWISTTGQTITNHERARLIGDSNISDLQILLRETNIVKIENLFAIVDQINSNYIEFTTIRNQKHHATIDEFLNKGKVLNLATFKQELRNLASYIDEYFNLEGHDDEQELFESISISLTS